MLLSRRVQFRGNRSKTCFFFVSEHVSGRRANVPYETEMIFLIASKVRAKTESAATSSKFSSKALWSLFSLQEREG